MSAICGMYLKNRYLDLKEPDAFFEELGEIQYDRSAVWDFENFFMGNYLSFITPESVKEILPLHDIEGSLIINADAIIDNRSELFELLNISSEQLDKSDSELILAAYKKWGVKCPEKLVGDFAFAIWDKAKHELFCARDHVGKRTLYYYNSSELFAFSTLINPLFKINGINKYLNDKFIAQFLSLPSVLTTIDSKTTIYQDVFQLPPASCLLMQSGNLSIWQYWKIESNNPVVFKTDEEYEEAFRNIFTEAVKCRLRSIKKIGIMLSGGLDSTAVAAIAAGVLKVKNQKLYGYTQVPIKDYQDWLPKTSLANEKPYVEELCKQYDNIEPSFIDSVNRNPLTEIDNQVDLLEQPYKNFQNSHWINEILTKAENDGVGVLLDGQSGNATVSWGSFSANIVDLLEDKDYRSVFLELAAYSRLQHTHILKTYARFAYNSLPLNFKKIIYKIKGGQDYTNQLSLINPEFKKEMGVVTNKSSFSYLKTKNSFTSRMVLLNANTFTHLGAIETKKPIRLSFVKRDPTRDKRVIEFCVNVPGYQWVRDGNERRLIRVAMKRILPEMIRANTAIRGKQAADWLQRIAPQWTEAWQEIDTIGSYKLERKYLDIAKIKDTLAKNKTINISEGENLDIWLLMEALIFARFLRKNFPENQ